MTLRHEPDVSKAAWFAARDEPWAQLSCFGPSGFDRYARVSHRARGATEPSDPDDGLSLEGNLADRQLELLVGVLAGHTSTPGECFFALWDGFGDIDGGAAFASLTRPRSHLFWRRRTVPPIAAAFPAEVMAAARVRIPHRSYLLFAGRLTDAGQWGAADVVPGAPRRINSPNLMWPADHAWFVATEIDQPWTGVGGSARLVEELITTEGLLVETAEPSEHLPY
jgi:hypothetical protein